MASVHRASASRGQWALFVLGLAMLGLSVPHAHAAIQTFTAQVVAVADGDTLRVRGSGPQLTIRLVGIDAPEKGQAYGGRAKEYLSGLAFGHTVTVEATGRDRYGRLLATIRLANGQSANEEIVRAGYAWWFRRYSRDRVLARLETEAREAHRGLWAELHPTPPWEFRRAHARTATGARHS